MAQQVNKSLTTRAQVDPRMTFDSTTPDLDVVARPINSAPNQDVSSKAQQLAQALGVFGEGLEGTAQGFQNRFNAEQEEGMFLAQKGEDKPTEGQYLIKGYETMEGELHARKFAREAEQYYHENYNKLDPEEFNEGLKALSQQYMEQAPSDNYLKSFIPTATQAEDQLLGRYNQDMAEEFQRQSLNMTSELIADELDKKVQNTLGTSLEGIIERPEDYLRTAIDIGESGIGETLRTTLTQMQQRGEALNLDKQTVSNLFVQQVGQVAIDTGMPELLDFASIEDSNKIRLETNPELMDTIESMRNKAETRRNDIIQMQDKEVQKQKEAEHREKQQLFTATLGNLEFMTPEERLNTTNEMEDMLLNDEAFDGMSMSEFRTYHDRLMDVKNGINKFADEPNSTSFVTLYEQARSGNLDNGTLIKEIPNLDKSSYTMLAGMIDKNNKALREEALNEEEKAQRKREERSEEYFNRIMPRVVRQMLDSRGLDATFEGDTDSAMETRMITDYWNLSEEYGRPLTPKEIDEQIFDPYVQAETKYSSKDAFISGESLSTQSGEDPTNKIKENEKAVNKAYDKAGAFHIFDKPEDYLPEGLTLESYTPERQRDGIRTIQTLMEDRGMSYTEISEALDSSESLSGQEGQDYLQAYFYNKTLNSIDSPVTGKTIISVQEDLRDQGVPEDLIKNIIENIQ